MKTMILLMAGALALAACTAPEPAPTPEGDGPVIYADCDADPKLCTYDDGKPK